MPIAVNEGNRICDMLIREMELAQLQVWIWGCIESVARLLVMRVRRAKKEGGDHWRRLKPERQGCPNTCM